MISEKRIIINPRCKTLVSHLENATWDKNRREFLRSGDYGHYDFVDALAYLVRNLDDGRNPYPAGYQYRRLSEKGAYFINPNIEIQDNNKYNKAFGEMFKTRSTFNRGTAKDRKNDDLVSIFSKDKRNKK